MPTAGELIKAATKGDVEEMQRLFDAGAEIEERDEVSEGGGLVSVVRGGWLWQSFVGRAWMEGEGCGSKEGGVGVRGL